MGTENILNGFLIVPQESGNTVVGARCVVKTLKKHFVFFFLKRTIKVQKTCHA